MPLSSTCCDCLHRDSAKTITCLSIKYLQEVRGMYIQSLSKSNCNVMPNLGYLNSYYIYKQLSKILLCLGTHCRFIEKKDVCLTSRSRHLFTIFYETLRDFSDFKVVWLSVNINIYLCQNKKAFFNFSNLRLKDTEMIL